MKMLLLMINTLKSFEMAWMVLKDAISKQNTRPNKWVCNIANFKAAFKANKFSLGSENPNQWNRR